MSTIPILIFMNHYYCMLDGSVTLRLFHCGLAPVGLKSENDLPTYLGPRFVELAGLVSIGTQTSPNLALPSSILYIVYIFFN